MHLPNYWLPAATAVSKIVDKYQSASTDHEYESCLHPLSTNTPAPDTPDTRIHSTPFNSTPRTKGTVAHVKMATFTPDQISRYLKHIGWDANFQAPIGTLAYLQELQKRQLARVPFEDLSLHYSPTHLLSLDPNDLFNKMVGRNMGGYCMENNTFFGAVLRTLGFSVINAGGRVSHATAGRPGPGYMGWSHMVNIVTIDGMKYLVDVGFGANEPTTPLALVSGHETRGIGTVSFKLLYTSLALHTDKSQRVWVYSHRDTEKDPNAPWTDAYAFSEMEFFPEDYEVMNLSTMTLRSSFFVQSVFCVKMTLDEKTGEANGWLMLTDRPGEVKRKTLNGMEVLESFRSEEGRIAALKRWFDIELTDAEKAGIRDLSTELRGWY